MVLIDFQVLRTCVVLTLIILQFSDEDQQTVRKKDPAVFVEILVRNKAHVLPLFLSLLSKVDYPKNRIVLWIRSDHNEDNTAEILNEWVQHEFNNYHKIDLQINDEPGRFSSEKSVADWTEERFRHLIQLREEALNLARKTWADYLWILDSDVLITEPSTLKDMISKNEIVVAPVLISDGMYSNFWCGMTESYYYKRTEQYERILNREITGCYNVPMVYSLVIIDLNAIMSDDLSHVSHNIPNYNGPVDDIIAFAVAAKQKEIPLHVCNDKQYGYIMTPLEENGTLELDRLRLTNLKLRAFDDNIQLPVDPVLLKYVELPKKQTYGLDKVYVINLVRRPERKQRMINCLNELGIEGTFMKAVDGKTLSDSQLKEMKIVQLPQYEDPYHKRSMKMGEIGCFLSHYNIWNNIINEGYEKVLVLEDDVSFSSYFNHRMELLMHELKRLKIKWDLVYIGRKRLFQDTETFVDNSRYLVYPSYSYWTLGYLLALDGAKKLVDANPLQKLVPVDEYLPIMYDKHPRDDWKQFYRERNLVALSSEPLLVHPLRYTHDEGYVSDTEDSNIISAYSEISGHEEL